MTVPRIDIAEALRRRIVSLVRAGALLPGDKLPSSRELSLEFKTDRRVVQAAYRKLASDGLVEQRERSGVYLRKRRVTVDKAGVSTVWVTELFAAALARDIPAPQLPELLRRAVDSRPVTAVTVATTLDQNEGMCRELRDDFGLQATCVSADALVAGPPWPDALHRAELIVTTEAHVPRVREVADSLGTRLIVGTVRRDLIGDAWRRLLLDGGSYVIVADRRFIPILEHYFRSVPAGGSIHFLVAGEDDVSRIPKMAPVYVTAAARDRLGSRRIPGRPIGSARVFSPETTKDILRFVVARQLETALSVE